MSASSGTVVNPIRYTAREFDTETGLYYYRARSYDVTVGRFTTEDPLRFQAAANFYAYVENNPANLTDPYGLVSMPKPICPQGEGNCGKKKCEDKGGDGRCWKRYLAEMENCRTWYPFGPDGKPTNARGYLKCADRADKRYRACQASRPDPGPLDPREWQE